MACGSPLIASATGGVPEIVEDYRNGLLCRAGDPAELAEKLKLLLKDSSLAARLGRQAAADCKENYHPERIARRTLDFYARVMEKWRTSKSQVF